MQCCSEMDKCYPRNNKGPGVREGKVIELGRSLCVL
jgi:hypothetical protein